MECILFAPLDFEVWEATLESEPVALLCGVWWKNRFYNFFPYSSETGRTHAAMLHIIDGIIQHYAGSPKYFDFEGSSLTGVAQFYRGFGARTTYYTQYSNK